MFPGLIERISNAGIARPQDLAGMITILRNKPPKSYLSIEVKNNAVEFLEKEFIIQADRIPKDALVDEKVFRRWLRGLAKAYDLITIDGFGLPLSPTDLWRFLEGGREKKETFGEGVGKDYGLSKLKPGTMVILNRADPACNELWFTLRARHDVKFQTQDVGMICLRV